MLSMTQKRVVSICAMVAAAVLPAVADEPTNAVQMVTYFPVPYAQYNNIYPTEKLDILGTGQTGFELLCGGSSTACSTDSVAFTANNVNLRSISGKKPTLKIAQDFRTKDASFGNTATTQTPTLQFNYLYLYETQATDGSSNELVLQGQIQIESLDQLTVWGKRLPACKNVQWVLLSFGNDGLKNYLVCCDSGTTSSICGTNAYQ